MALVSSLVSTLHILALVIGLPAVFFRGRALKNPNDDTAIDRALMADNIWGIAAILWIATGLARAFGPLERGSAFYLQSGAFYVKMGLFSLAAALELWPMMTLVRWRIRLAQKLPIDRGPAAFIRRASFIEAAIILIMAFIASAMARGIGVLQ